MCAFVGCDIPRHDGYVGPLGSAIRESSSYDILRRWI